MKKLLSTVFAVLACASMCAQTFSYSGGTLTVTVNGDLSTDADAPAKIQNEISQNKPEVIKVVGGGKISANMIKACLYGEADNSDLQFNTPNMSTVTLDLGEVTLAGTWNYTTFRSSWNGYSRELALKTLTLPKREDNVIPDFPFFQENEYGQANFDITTVVIPEGYVEVGAYAFNKMRSITSVSFPKTLKTIGDMAFANLDQWTAPKLNEGLEFIGNSAFALETAVTLKTLEVPSSVKYMGPGAFLCRRFQEVYFRGVEAPMCPKGNTLIGLGEQGTFGTEVLMGNGSFNAEPSGLADNACQNGVANRENYKNDGVYFSILHYPSNLTDEQRAKYTDITKKYETWEGNQWGATTGFHYATTKVVGKESGNLSYGDYNTWGTAAVCPGYKDTYLGEQYIWPSQSQWMRSYITASNGLCWDGVTEYAPTLTDEQIALLRKAGFSEAEYSVEQLAKIAYVGTRQFVLGNGDASTTPEYTLPVKQGGRWWTLCVPFNMTKKMVDESFGKDTQVCRFSKVVREFDTDGNGRGNGKSGNHITLLFRNDVYKHKYVKDANGNYPEFNDDDYNPCEEDDDIVIYAHEAYMVKPTKTDADAVFVVNDYTYEPGAPIPTVIVSEEYSYLNGVQSQSVDDGHEYRFIGNSLATSQTTGKAMSVPQNSYYYGKSKATDTNSQFWFWPYDKHLSWPANKCIVQTTEAETGQADAVSFFSVNLGVNQAKQASVFGTDGNDDKTTAVEQVEVEILAGDDCQPIYNINGQLVSGDGSTKNLTKGVYVKGGKKFVVK